MDVNDQILLIHWIDAPDDVDIESASETIAHQFERTLKGFVK